MSPFYKPISQSINSVPTIIYPMIGVEKVVHRDDPQKLSKLVQRVSSQCLQSVSVSYMIIILWADADSVMTDVWLFTSLESVENGYTVDCKTYRGDEEIHGNGLSASDGLIMLGREAEQEEEMRKSGKSVQDYIFGTRPHLPEPLDPTEDFIIA